MHTRGWLQPWCILNGSFQPSGAFQRLVKNYTQEVTTSQRLASNDLTGVWSRWPTSCPDDQNQIVSGGSLGLSNEQFLQKSFNLGVTYLRSRTGWTFAAFSDNREFQDPTQNEDTYGVGALWSWRFAPRTASFLGGGLGGVMTWASIRKMNTGYRSLGWRGYFRRIRAV